MNTKLEEAFARAATLPEDDQETIAWLIMEEVASMRQWDEQFANSQDQLGELARRARERHERGETISWAADRKQGDVTPDPARAATLESL